MTVLKFRLDETGFPMVWVEEIGAYMHWAPVTKIQFEYFLCAASDMQFDEHWYEEICSLNPRVSPKGIRQSNYWNAFLSGVFPDEAQRFARWCGDGYSLPTLKDWFTAYKALKALPPEPSVIDELDSLRERTRTVLTQLDAASSGILREVGYDRTLADQMLMRMGAMEWVDCHGESRSPWGGMGETPSGFHGNLFTPDYGQPSIPVNPDTYRLHYYGFRLIWRHL